jgi:hypothetical protein
MMLETPEQPESEMASAEAIAASLRSFMNPPESDLYLKL